jgi:UDP:flavonoid glycosyltransferase YjiC (YdhE family)
VVELGAGIKIRPEELTAERLASAIAEIRGNPAYRRSARHAAEDIQRFDGARAAARLVQAMVA